MENQKLISKFDTINRVTHILFFLLFVGLSMGCLYNYNIKDITTTFYLIGFIFFIVFAFLIVGELNKSPKIIVHSDKIELVRIFNTKTNIIELQNIQSWLIRKKKSKSGDFEILYLVLNDFSRLKIKSYNYSNFYQLEQKLTNKKPVNIELEKELNIKENKQYSIAFILIGIIFLFITSKNYENKKLSFNDISIVKGHLSEPLKIERGRRSKTLVIKLNEFPQFNFRVGGMALGETYYDDLIKDFNRGQALEFAVEREVYDKKISKKTKLTFWDLIFHYDKIPVVEITDNDFKYLSLEDYNSVHDTNNKWIIGFFGLLGSILTIGGIVLYKRRNE
jgi:hypothetical protein